MAEQYFPISELSTYQARWMIRARITMMGQLRSFSSKRDGGEQRVFEVHVLDESGVEISASFFGGMADKYFPLLQQGKCYTFSRGAVRIANRQYNRCPHRYQIVFDRDALIEEAADVEKIETVKFSFSDLHAVQSKAAPCTVDLVGVVTNFKSLFAFTSKEGKELVKREITIADDTATSMVVAIWGERAKQEDKVFEGQPVVCLKGVGIREWNGGKSGSLMEAGVMKLRPSNMPEAQRLEKWWAQHGKSTSFTSLSLSISQEGLMDLRTLQAKELPCTVELCGVVVGFKPPFSFTSQAGKELVKREITLADDTAMSMMVTLWGDRAQQPDAIFDNHTLVSIKGVIVKEWNGGRSGSLTENGNLTFQPSTPEAQRIRDWWTQGGSSQSLTALSQDAGAGGGGAGVARSPAKASTVAEMRKAADQVSSQPEVYSIVSRLSFVQTRKQGESQPLYYMACQESKPGTSFPCNKRVGEDGFCAACNRAGRAVPRLNLRCKFSDFGDSAWMTTFNEAAQRVLDASAEETQALEAGAGGREALEASIRRRYFQEPLQVTVRARLESYNGELRSSTTCVDARPVNRGAHGRIMLKSISEMLAREPVAAF